MRALLTVCETELKGGKGIVSNGNKMQVNETKMQKEYKIEMEWNECVSGFNYNYPVSLIQIIIFFSPTKKKQKKRARANLSHPNNYNYQN